MRVVAYDIVTMGTQINKLHCAVACSRVQSSSVECSRHIWYHYNGKRVDENRRWWTVIDANKVI